MGGGSGVIIVQNNQIVIKGPVSMADQATLNQVASRSPVKCSMLDAITVCRIIWKLLR